MPIEYAEILRAKAMQIGRAEADGLENPHNFETSGVERSGRLQRLRSLGKPADVLKKNVDSDFCSIKSLEIAS